MDDIVIYVSSLEEHERKYNLLIERLIMLIWNCNLTSKFFKTEVTYLGHVISRDGVRRSQEIRSRKTISRRQKILNNFSD